MCNPKRIEDITISDLIDHRWCYYHSDEEGYGCFEYVIPDTHPAYSEDISQMELAEFKFKEGKIVLGMYDGSESFHIVDGDSWYSFWYGVARPSECAISQIKHYLANKDLRLPVEVNAKWSGKTKVFKGLQYINKRGDVVEITI